MFRLLQWVVFISNFVNQNTIDISTKMGVFEKRRQTIFSIFGYVCKFKKGHMSTEDQLRVVRSVDVTTPEIIENRHKIV